jgi:CheY-like chemotaxis protein
MKGDPIEPTSRRALVVDDDEAIRRVLARAIGQSGWAVDVVATGAEALQTFKVGRYNLVMTDIDLGDGLDGITLARQLLTLEPTLRIRLMSGTSSTHVDRAKAAGLGPILEKPFEFQEIAKLLEE